MRLRSVVTALTLMALCAFAQATPSTLVWIPSTDIQPSGTWHLGIDNYFTPGGNGTALTDYGLTYGLLDGRAEVGIDYFAGYEHPATFNAKYLLCPESPGHPALAVGAYFVGIQSGVTDANVVYAIGSRTLGKVRVHFGYAHGKKSTLGGDPNMVLAGLDGCLTRDQKWWWGADYQSGDSSLGAFNLGVAYKFAPNVGVLLGYDRYNASGLDNTVTTQLDIDF